MPLLGKFNPVFLGKTVYPRLGAVRSEVIAGPKFGVDNAIIRIPRGRILAISTDPISLIPALGVKDSAWLSVHNLASDVTTSGFPPAYAVVDFNLPPEMADSEFEQYWRVFEEEFGKMGTMIVGGHTGRFEGCGYTIIGGSTVIAVGDESRYLSSDRARVGDSLILTKGAALSASGILAKIFPHSLEDKLSRKTSGRAQQLFREISSVQDALTLASVGVRDEGVSAMHDCTEGGVFAAIYEMATASETGVWVEKDQIPVDETVREICEVFRLDPYTSLSEGALLASIRPDKVDDAIESLRKAGIPGAVIGKVVAKSKGIRLSIRSGNQPLTYPKADPYWKTYWKGIENGWK